MAGDVARSLLLGALAAGFLAGLLLAAPAAAGRPRTPWPARAVVALGIIGAVALIAYAGSPDGYYGEGVSRWDHAGRNGARPLVVAAIVLAAAAAGTLALVGRPHWRPVSLLLGALACGAVAAAIIGVSIGH